MFGNHTYDVGGNVMSITEIQGLVADSFFSGDAGIAGMVMFAIVMMVIFGTFGTEHITGSFMMMLPITVIFSSLRILPDAMAILLIVIAVAGLATSYKDKII